MSDGIVFDPALNRPHNTQNSRADVVPGGCADIADTSGRSVNAIRLFCDL
jgi:hypothetical protein